MNDQFWGTADVVKRHKRLHIVVRENDRVLYTPPDFVQLPNRAPLEDLARKFTELQRRDIDLITDLEYRYRKKK